MGVHRLALFPSFANGDDNENDDDDILAQCRSMVQFTKNLIQNLHNSILYETVGQKLKHFQQE